MQLFLWILLRNIPSDDVPQTSTSLFLCSLNYSLSVMEQISLYFFSQLEIDSISNRYLFLTILSTEKKTNTFFSCKIAFFHILQDLK